MQATSLVGEYAVAGKNEHGDFYEGKATISSKGPGRYLVSWDLGDEELLIHEAYVKGNNLHVDFYAAVYEVRNDGILEGKWGAAGGYETLTPYLLVRAGSTGTGETDALAAQDTGLATPPAGQAGSEPGQLDGELIGALHFALLDAFTPDTMRQMTRIYLDQALENIAGGSDFSGVTFNLIAWAERNGRLPELLNGAIAAVPGNARLKDCAASIRAYLA
jgi:hypothetical protein